MQSLFSPHQATESGSHQKTARTALLAAFGLTMFLFESGLPRPLPWAKPGLANIATLLALYALGAGSAWAVTIVRVVVGSFLIGSFFSPGFWLSLGGGVLSCSAMVWAHRHASRWFSIVGISLLGALAHVLAQLTLAGILIVQRLEILYLLPLMLWPALFAGFLTGVASSLLLERMAIMR